MRGSFIFKYKKAFYILIMLSLYVSTYSFGKSNAFMSKWSKPDYNDSIRPDLETVKRIGRLYFAMKKNKKLYSIQEFEKDLIYLNFSKKDIKYLQNKNTITFIKNYIKQLSILENGIPDYEVFIN